MASRPVAYLLVGAVLILPAVAAPQTNVVRGSHGSIVERLEALEAAVASLQTENQSLRTQVSALQDSHAMALEPYLTVTHDARGPLVLLAGVNLQVVNGMGSTDTLNSLGNVIVGYDETAPEGSAPACDDWDWESPSPAFPCVAAKIGSHNLVTGSYNTYTQYGGLVAGTLNTVSSVYSTVSGGARNKVSAAYSSIGGGSLNRTDGKFASVSGGTLNQGGGKFASVSGGSRNRAGADESSILGGERNWVSGIAEHGRFATISGGYQNIATAWHSTIVGGGYNRTNSYSDENIWFGATVCGGYNNATNGAYSSIGGGKDRSTTTDYSWVAGSLVQPQ